MGGKIMWASGHQASGSQTRKCYPVLKSTDKQT